MLHQFDYTFKPNTPFVHSIESIRAGTSVLTQSYDRDGLGRVAGAGAALTGGGAVYGVDYQFDDLNRRRQADLADGTYWDYGYNDRGEVTAGKRHLDATTFAGGKQFEYNYDDIGNRLVARFGGDAAGGGLSESVYNPANALNQLTARMVPGEIWLTGEAPGSLSLEGVSEGGAFAVEQQAGDRFYGMATVNNSAGPVQARITVAGKNNGALVDVQTGHQFVPAAPESFGYDHDGNLTSDGRWMYVWDAENRLIRMVSATAVGAQRRLEFTYDWMGRRVGKKVWDNVAGTGAPVLDQRFVYHGWNLLAILDASSAVQQSFTWGLDLSGTLQGAGGVGGLLAVHDAATLNNQPSTHFTAYDGNGNVMGLVNAADGSVSARYEYAPFGELIQASGLMASANPFRFSTKWQDEETGLLYYGYRYYDPGTGRWLNRDPLEEAGGLNLYGFVDNNPIQYVDPFGLRIYIIAPEVGGLDGTGFSDHVVAGFQQIIGDCAKLEKIPIFRDVEIGIWRWKRTERKLVGWEISYRDEKPDCLCQPCWKWLKAALSDNLPKWDIHIRRPRGRFEDGRRIDYLNNATARPDGVVKIVEGINPLLPTVSPDGSVTWTPTPFEVVLWHEAIGHGYRKLGPHLDEAWNRRGGSGVDPIIAEENNARNCLRLQGISINDRVPTYYGWR